MLNNNSANEQAPLVSFIVTTYNLPETLLQLGVLLLALPALFTRLVLDMRRPPGYAPERERLPAVRYYEACAGLLWHALKCTDRYESFVSARFTWAAIAVLPWTFISVSRSDFNVITLPSSLVAD